MGFITEKLSGVLKPRNRMNWSLSGVVDLETKNDNFGIRYETEADF